MPRSLAELAFGPNVSGAIIRGAEGRAAIEQLGEFNRQRRSRRALDEAFAGGVPSDPAARQNIEQQVFRTGGAEAGLQVRQLFQDMNAAERAQAAQEGRMVAIGLAGVRDQGTYDRARAGLARRGIDVSTLPEEFDPQYVRFAIDSARDLEDVLETDQPSFERVKPGETLVRTDEGRATPVFSLPAEPDTSRSFSQANALRDEFIKQNSLRPKPVSRKCNRPPMTRARPAIWQ